jgi:hypothetical protein
LFGQLARDSPLVQPDWDAIEPWRGIPCASIADALHLMRERVASNVLARREDVTVFVPENS